MSTRIVGYAEINDIAGAERYITAGTEKDVPEVSASDENYYIIASPMHAVKPTLPAPKRSFGGWKKTSGAKAPNGVHLMVLMRLVHVTKL